MTKPFKPATIGTLLSHPRAFVSRLILADLIAKRGEGPLERKGLVYKRRKP